MLLKYITKGFHLTSNPFYCMKNIIISIVLLYATNTSYVNAQDLYWGDFENNVSWWNTWGGAISVVENPLFEGNTSSRVLKYVPDSLWRGISIYFEKPPLNPSHIAVSLYAYAESSTALQLGLPSKNMAESFFLKDTLIGGNWRYIEFNISNLKVHTYKYIIIQTVEITNYYFDNIMVRADPNYVEPENPLMPNISLFPNPSRNFFNVTNLTETSEMTISNSRGQKILQKKVENNEQIPISSFGKGIYFIEIKNKDQVKKSKIIKL